MYIAAPYAAPTPEGIAENVRRACLLARYAVSQGLAPVVLHPAIAAGAYGDEASPEERERGLQCAVEIARTVAAAGGRLWLIMSPHRDVSEGSALELVQFMQYACRTIPWDITLSMRTWAEWAVEITFP